MSVLRICTIAGDSEAETELARSIGELEGADLYMRCTDRVGTVAALRSGMVDALVLVGDPGWFDQEVAAESRTSGVNLVGVTSDVFEAESLLALGCLLVGNDAGPEAIFSAASAPGATTTEAKPPLPGGDLVAVWGPKGSPGATTIAIELACLFARMDPMTSLVDADTYGADCVQLLGVEDELPSLVWACRSALRRGSDDPSFLSELKRIGSDGPILVPGLPRSSMWNEVSAPSWDSLRRALRSMFTESIVDVGSCIEVDQAPWSEFSEGRNHVARSALGDADRIVAVVDASPTGVKHFIDAFEEVERLNAGEEILVVANRVDTRDASSVSRLVEEGVGRKPVALLPDVSRDLKRARSLGRPLCELRPTSPLVTQLESVATRLGLKLPARGLLTRLSGRR